MTPLDELPRIGAPATRALARLAGYAGPMALEWVGSVVSGGPSGGVREPQVAPRHRGPVEQVPDPFLRPAVWIELTLTGAQT